MQTTREKILKYLKEKGEATVDELSSVLGGLTSVTVRHHLDILRGDGFVSDPMIRHRATPGRPQYAYTLTGKASEHFPKNYRDLAGHLMDEMRLCPPPQGVNVFFEGVASRMSALAPPPVPGEALDQRHKKVTCQLWDRVRLPGETQVPEDAGRRLTAPPWLPPTGT